MSDISNHPRFEEFVKSVGVPFLIEKVTPQTPWSCFSQEYGVLDLPSAGGLGYLAGDWMILAEELGIPFCGVGLYYRTRWIQTLDRNFLQKEHTHFTPCSSDFGFQKLKQEGANVFYSFETDIYPIKIDIFVRKVKGNPLIMLYESGIKGLYEGGTRDEHRLYQAAVLGFAGIFALFKMGLDPSILHLNESQTVVAAIALLDYYCSHGYKFSQSLDLVRQKTIFTNHTLSPAAEAVWTKRQLLQYVGRNLKCDEIKNWFAELIKSYKDDISFSDFAYLLSGKVNAVSKLHAIEAGKAYARKFDSVTNGVSFRWVNSLVLEKYKEKKILDDKFLLPTENYRQNLVNLTLTSLMKIKSKMKVDLTRELEKGWKNQYGHEVVIPETAKIAVWARRFATYKRPFLLFEDVPILSAILEKYDIYLLLSGRAHQTDMEMKEKMAEMFKLIDINMILKKRVHFIQNYGWRISRFLVTGADIWVNTPIIGTEACGTSWEKAVLNWALLCSTPDGGIADVLLDKDKVLIEKAFLNIKDGMDDKLAAKSLYENLEKAGDILSDREIWRKYIISQLQVFLPVTSGPRMMGEYLSLIFNAQENDNKTKIL
jgi:glycogen phosphorylase